jgi:hypothetical protein
MIRFIRVVALSTGVALAVGVAVASAGTPFGGDDTTDPTVGPFIPSDSPNGPVTTCEKGVATAASKLFGAILNCHALQARGKVGNPPTQVSEDGCEFAAITKFEATNIAGCDRCTGGSTLGQLAQLIEETVDDGLSPRIYCDNTGTRFGTFPDQDDEGFIPPDAPTGPETKCSNGVAKAVSKLVGSITKCHIRRAQGTYTSDSAENGCESKAEAKFATTTKTAGCPACIGSLAALASFVEASLEVLSCNVVSGGCECIDCSIWCGSPSGAFLP